MTHRSAAWHSWAVSTPLCRRVACSRWCAFLMPLLLLLLVDNAQYGDAACSTVVQPKDVNESTVAGYNIQDLDASYQLSAALSIDPVYACYFEISTGALRLKKQFDLENFTSCSDGSTVPAASIPSAVTVSIPCVSGDTATFLIRLVDINEFPPIFLPNTSRISVSEGAAVGTLVIQLNSYIIDRDKSNQRTFNFQIVNGSQGDFAMNDGVTSGIVRIQRALDYDAGTRQYVMNISASDLPTEASSLPVPLTGYATLTVDVTDTDDRNPYFTQTSYDLYFMENDTSLINRPLSTNPVLEARDGDVGINQTINYAIASVSWSGVKGSLLGNVTFLSINQTTGQFTVLSMIDREALPSNNLIVQVKGYQTDKPDTRSTIALLIVTVGDKNDNAPIMDSALYNVSIAESSLVGSYVATVKATDADMGENATFVFKLNDTTNAFQVDPSSGQVTVANSSLLDRETRVNFVMTVWAQESLTPEQFRSPASQLIVNLIDVNDNSPVFVPPNASYSFMVSADAPVGQTIGFVAATDADQGENGLVRFSIAWLTGGSIGFGQAFQLDAVTGVLKTNSSLSGVTTSTAVLLQVVAEDQATPVTARRQSRAVVQITIVTTQTTAPSSQAVTTQLLHYNGTAAPAASAAVPDSAVQIALIVICALLLLAVIVLAAVMIWCWKTRQPRPLKAVNASLTTLGNGNSAAHHPQSAAEAGTASSVTAAAPAPANQLESSYALNPMTQTADDGSLPRPDGLASAAVASLFLSLTPCHSSTGSPTTTATHLGESGVHSPSRDSIGSTFDWLNEGQNSSQAAGIHNYWCLPASATVNTAL